MDFLCHTAAEVHTYLLPDQSTGSGPSARCQSDLTTRQLCDLDISTLCAAVFSFVKGGSHQYLIVVMTEKQNHGIQQVFNNCWR